MPPAAAPRAPRTPRSPRTSPDRPGPTAPRPDHPVQDRLVLVVVVAVTEHRSVLHPHERLAEPPADIRERIEEHPRQTTRRIRDVDRRAVATDPIDLCERGSEQLVQAAGGIAGDRQGLAPLPN